MLLVCLAWLTALNACTEVPVRVAGLAQLTVYPEQDAPATVLSLNDSHLGAELSAKVLAVLAEVRGGVAAGAPLHELDDIEERLDSVGPLFLLDPGLIYSILGTQLKSYFQLLNDPGHCTHSHHFAHHRRGAVLSGYRPGRPLAIVGAGGHGHRLGIGLLDHTDVVRHSPPLSPIQAAARMGAGCPRGTVIRSRNARGNRTTSSYTSMISVVACVMAETAGAAQDCEAL